MVMVAFKPWEREVIKCKELYQYDYGQILRIQGIPLPPAVEIHFSLQETGGTSLTRIGITKDGVTDVPIPDSMLENEDVANDYSIYAFVYLTDETSGKTEYRITLRVKARPKPEVPGGGDNPDIFHEAVEAVREAMEAAAESEKQAEGWAHGREDLPERTQDNAKYYSDKAREDSIKTDADRKEVERLVESVSGIEEQVEKVDGLTKQAQKAATDAGLYKEAAESARKDAETAKTEAETAAGKTAEDKTAVETAKGETLKAQETVSADRKAVESIKFGIEQLSGEITGTVEQGMQELGAAKQQAVQAVQTEGTTQTGKVTAEGEKQIKAVSDKGQEVLQSIPEDFPAQMATKLDKQQGVENKGKALVVGEDGNIVPGEVQGGSSEKQMELIESYAIEQSDAGFEIPIGSEYQDVLVEIKIKPKEVAALRMKFDNQDVLFITTGSYLGDSNLLQLFMHKYGGYADGWLKKISYETQINTNSFNSMKIKGMPKTITLTPWKTPNVIGVEAATAYVYAR